MKKISKTQKSQAKQTPLKQIYLRSFRQFFTKRFGLAVAFDVLFYLAILGAVYLFSKASVSMLAPIQSMITAAQYSGVPLGNPDSIKAAVIKFLLSAVFLGILSLFLWAASRALIWTALLEKKFSAREILKTSLGSMIWTALWLIPIALIIWSLVGKQKAGIIFNPSYYLIFFVIYAIIQTYFSYIMYFRAISTQKIFSSMKEALSIGTKSKYLAISALLGLTTLIVIFSVGQIFVYAPENIQLAVSYIILFGSCSWVKLYAADVFRNI